MKISVITPSFNQAQFLPVNLQSVEAQVGVDVEHIVVDPGSKDGSTEIARQFPGVTLIAEPDRGQSDGICKGFARSTGDILVWLNSDDFYPDNQVLLSVMQCFEEHPDIDIVYGDVNFVDEQGEFLRRGFVNKNESRLLESFQYQVGLVQPGIFWRRRVFEELGGPSEEFEYCMDYELWVRMAVKGYTWKHLPRVLAHHRWWGGMKTSSRRDLSLREHFKVCDRYFGYVHWKWLDRYADYLCSKQDGVVHHATSIDMAEKAKAIRIVIDEVVTQEMLRKLSLSNEPEMVATRQYIHYHYPDKHRIYFGTSELDIVSEQADDPKALQRIAWNVFDVTASDGKAFKSYHVPDNFDRYFEQSWHRLQLNRTRSGLERLSMERRGDTCVIVGNGPSLRKSDLTILENVDTIISNFAVLSPDLRRFAKILTVVNDLVAKQGAIDFNASQFIKVVPFWLGNYFNDSDNTFFVNATVRPEFSVNFADSASWRSTVSFFNMQLAYAIGYRKVVLIGFDHSYVQPKEMTEGSVISQVGDDENHFDPRYFKGKDWQAADTVNMEKMYALAKDAYEKDGREIVNCTEGGKLELFRRGDLRGELGIEPSNPARQVQATHTAHFPKLLMIDAIPIGHKSATGQIKMTFLSSWPKSSFLQIWETGGPQSTLHTIGLEQSIETSLANPLSSDDIVSRCRLFQPDVIYFRPIDSESLFEIAERIISAINKPLVIHMMDDWPERLRLTDYVKFMKLDFALRCLLAHSSCRLSICDAMSRAYNVRYGGDWQALANGVDLNDFPARDWSKRPKVSPSAPAVIRYMGGLADDMTFASVRDIAEAVSALQSDIPVLFEIYTMDWCLPKADQELGTLAGVTVFPLVDYNSYLRLLREADILVIAYNFDTDSLNYVGLSLANKMPECLASGATVLAYGPKEVATIDYLKNAHCAQVLDQRDVVALKATIKHLVTDSATCQQLSNRGRAFAEQMLSKQKVQNQFRALVDAQTLKANTQTYCQLVQILESTRTRILCSSMERLKKFEDIHAGKRCVIIGNGPSLNKMDLSFLEQEICFGMNRIFLLFEQWRFRPTYYASVNPLVLEQSAEEILKLGAPKFLSAIGIPFFPDPPEEMMFIRSLPTWDFFLDPREGLCEGWTVTFFAMQLAYYMGFSEVVLIGVDHHYETQGDPNREVVSEGADPNHFHPDYFGKGFRWHLPDLERSEGSYMLAKLAFEADGRRILDATVDGKLTIFPKVDYRKYFAVPYDNRNPVPVIPTVARDVLDQTNILIGMGRTQDAFSFIENKVRLLPFEASLPFALGLMSEYFQSREISVGYFESAVRLDPRNINYLMKLATCYHQVCGKSKEALNLLQMVIKADEKNVEAYRLIAEICHANGQPDDAQYFGEIAARLTNA